MNSSSYFNDKKYTNIQEVDNEQNIAKMNRYNESEHSREDDLPLNENLFNEKSSVIKGMSLAFVFFSVIIYSLLYMLAPEKSANLIFIGNYPLELFNNNYCSHENKTQFYKLDSLRERNNELFMGLSLKCHSDDISKNLTIKIIFNEEKKIIYDLVVNSDNKEKKFNISYYKFNEYDVNDFPFWLNLYNKESNNFFNLTSNDLINFFQNAKKNSI